MRGSAGTPLSMMIICSNGKESRMGCSSAQLVLSLSMRGAKPAGSCLGEGVDCSADTLLWHNVGLSRGTKSAGWSSAELLLSVM